MAGKRIGFRLKNKMGGATPPMHPHGSMHKGGAVPPSGKKNPSKKASEKITSKSKGRKPKVK